MNGNLAYQDAPWDELINGETVLMSPRPSVQHNWIAGNIFVAFSNHLKGKKCIPFGDGTDVYLTEDDRVIPDVMIICRTDIIKRNGIHGAPNLVVEVLSPGTAKKDRGYKKDLYERTGVREYWIVGPEARSIEVYLLTDGKYVLDEVYSAPPEDTDLTEEEREQHKKEIKISLCDGFSISLDEIFSRLP